MRTKRYAGAVTKLLQTAIEKLSKLPDKEQDVYAHFIIDELDAERQWEAALAGTQDQSAWRRKPSGSMKSEEVCWAILTSASKHNSGGLMLHSLVPRPSKRVSATSV